MSYVLQFIPDDVRTISWMGNTVEEYIIAGVIFILLLLAFRLFHYTALWRLEALSEKTENEYDDVAIDVIQTIRWWFYVVVSLWLALFSLSVPATMTRAIEVIMIILAVYQVVKAANILVAFFVEKKFEQTSDGQQDSIVALLSKIVKGVVWVLGFLFVLQNLGVDVTSLIAGLGVGGIAIALALQNILSDLFSSFSIYFDKPFTVGDFIAIGDFMGTVEHIGIKTTRVRSMQGEEIILANRELTTARIQNYHDVDEWRDTFSVGVSYDTAPDSLDEIKATIKDVISSMKKVRFDRANATAFGDSAITFDVVFYSKTRDYNTHLANMHAIHTELKRRFDQQGVDIAFPTRTVHLHQANS